MTETDPATPTQLAANTKAASDAVDGGAGGADDAMAVYLSDLVDAVGGMFERYAAMGDATEPEIAALVDDWRTTHEGHRDELSAALVALGSVPGAQPVVAPALRQVAADLKAAVSGIDAAALAALLADENKLLDRYSDAARADPAHRKMLDRQRAALVALANRTQDAIDG